MPKLDIVASKPLRGSTAVPGDKSISHRALLLGALASGTSQISGFLPSGDCLATLRCVRALGITVDVHDDTTLSIHGRGLAALQRPASPLDCARSGTTMRLLAGILVGQRFPSTLTGEAQLLNRPMRRIVEPLRLMGAAIDDVNGGAPLTIHAATLHGFEHKLAVASAQVKSALLLAGLYAEGTTIVHQPGPARDHTERMMAAMGAVIDTAGLSVTLSYTPRLSPLSLSVPGDVSSASFLLAAAAIVPRSDITILDVGLNPTRTGFLDVLRDMQAELTVSNERVTGNEPIADVSMRAARLRGVEIGSSTVVRMIDEFPALAVAATQAEGTTVVRDAAELRVKETDRIDAIVTELRAMGANIEALPDGFVIKGPTLLRGTAVDSHGDHRLAMALALAGLVAEGKTIIQNASCIADSFPGFESALAQLAN